MLDTLHTKAGQQQLLFLDQQEGAKKWEHLQAICAKINIECPKPEIGPHEAHIANTAIEPGFFTAGDDKPATILKHVVVKGTGICLMNAEEAQQWLQDIAPISGDPLAVLIPADQGIHAERPHQEIIVPMRDPQGRAVLVATKMYQLGQTDVKIAEMQSKKIDLQTESHMLICIYKDEFKQDEWEKIAANPVRESRGLLRDLGWTANFSKVWGRRYLRNDVQVKPDAAEYISFRVMIPAETEEEMLKLSGAKGLYTISFEGEGKPKKQYKIVWVAGSKQDLLVRSASVQSHGVVRNKSGVGLRVNRENFESAFKGLRPGDEIPEEFDVQYKWKIESWPFGTTSEGGSFHWLANQTVKIPWTESSSVGLNIDAAGGYPVDQRNPNFAKGIG